MPNPKLETYKNKATGTVYDYTDAAAQAALADILDGTDIDSFSDVETALATKVDKVTGKGLSTNDYDDTEKAKVAGAFPRSEQAVLGAKNLANLEYREMTNNSTFTESNGVYTIANDNGTSQYPSMKIYKTSAFGAFPAGKYTLSVNIVSFTNNTAVLAFRDASNNGILSSKALSVGKMSITYESAIPFTIGFLLRVDSTADAEIQFSEFMLALDNDLTYARFTMTNELLTDAVLKSVPTSVDTNTFVLDMQTGSFDLNDVPLGLSFTSNGNAANIQHKPTEVTASFAVLTLEQYTGFRYQIMMLRDNPSVVYRRSRNNTNVWESWYKFTGISVS